MLPNDYTLCNNYKCPLATKCDRYLSLMNLDGTGRVILSHFEPVGNDCDYFIEIKK
jgi:hypothetical protein